MLDSEDITWDESIDENLVPKLDDTVRIGLREYELKSKDGVTEKLVVTETRMATPKRRPLQAISGPSKVIRIGKKSQI